MNLLKKLFNILFRISEKDIWGPRSYDNVWRAIVIAETVSIWLILYIRPRAFATNCYGHTPPYNKTNEVRTAFNNDVVLIFISNILWLVFDMLLMLYFYICFSYVAWYLLLVRSKSFSEIGRLLFLLAPLLLPIFFYLKIKSWLMK